MVALLCFSGPVMALEQGPAASDEPRKGALETPTTEPPKPSTEPEKPLWHYGGFADLAYSLNFNFPENHQWRNRTTTPRVNELDLNMAAVYVRKDISESSRWGMELLGQGGQDAKDFGFGANQPTLLHSDALRHLGRANVSYLAPIGRGVTVQAGIFNSLIGYDSLYSKDNFTYTRPWGGDYTPYTMMGVNASYPVTEQLTATVFIVNEYFHLQHTNNAPSYGAQAAYKPSSAWTLKESIYAGPDQANTSMEYWRFFSDSIAEWKGDTVTAAFEYQLGTERLAIPGRRQILWTAAQLPVNWQFAPQWTITVRPELYWDPSGRLTGYEQFVKALTGTLGYRVPYRWTTTILRAEYRYDESTGSGGGFFKDGSAAPGTPRLVAAQHMLIFSAVWTFDSP